MFLVLAGAVSLVGLAQLIFNHRILPPIPDRLTAVLGRLPRLPDVLGLGDLGLAGLLAMGLAALGFALWARALGVHRRILALPAQGLPPLLPMLGSRPGLVLWIGGLCAFLVTLVQTLAAARPPAAWAWLTVVGSCLALGWLADHQNGARPLAEQSANLAFLGLGASVVLGAALAIRGWIAPALATGIVACLVALLIWRRYWARWSTADRWERLVLLVLMGVHLALVGYGLDSWRWSIREDETVYLDVSREMFSKPDSWALTGPGIYGYHIAQELIPTAVTTRLLGNDVVAFRLANPILLALGLPFWQYCFRRVVGVRAALVSLALLTSAHMLQCFGKIGYSNVQVLPWLGLALAAATWAATRGRWFAVALLGVVLGQGFFLYATARLLGPILAMWMLAHFPPVRRRAVAPWAFVVISALVVATPILLNFELWAALRSSSPLDPAVGTDAIIRGMLHRAAVSPLLFIHNEWFTHFVQCADTDPLTGSAVVLGIGVWLASLCRRPRQVLAWLGMYLTTCVLVASLQNHDYPSNTRMFLLVPFWTLTAAVGLTALAQGLCRGRGAWRRMGRTAILSGACLVAGGVNTWICLGPSQWLQMDGALGDRGMLMLMAERTRERGHRLLVVQCEQVSVDYAQAALASVGVPRDRYAFVPLDDLPARLVEDTERPAMVLLIRCPELADQVRATVAQHWPRAEESSYAHLHDSSPMLCFANSRGAGELSPAPGYWLETPPRLVTGTPDTSRSRT